MKKTLVQYTHTMPGRWLTLLIESEGNAQYPSFQGGLQLGFKY